ncbi:MAG: hypothetical protein ACK47B_24970 [Armatimonadota bacterium]
MRDGIQWSLAAGLLLGALVFFLMPHWWAVPAAILAAALPPLVGGWWRARERVREYCRSTPAPRWVPAPAGEPAQRVAPYLEELRGLGYDPIGWLGQADGAPETAVAVHRELPIFAFVTLDQPQPGEAVVQLDTFFDDGRLTSTGLERLGECAAHARTAGPRLIQLRDRGTPTALDGQHVGTVKPWLGSKRRALPTDRDALPGYLAEDHRRLAEALRDQGWLSFSDYVRRLLGKRNGVLTF